MAQTRHEPERSRAAAHEIERMYGYSKASVSEARTMRYVCSCGMPLAMTAARSKGVHRAHMLNVNR